MKRILTLCVGNICRSPIAESILKSEFPNRTIWSAGLNALVGKGADPLAIEVAGSHGFDLTEHRAQQVAGWMCQSADLILVMEDVHRMAVEQQFPFTRGRVFRLGELGKFDIADPYRGSRSVFELAYQDIARSVADWSSRIKQLG